MAGARVNAWASRLTRFTSDSDLARLNADPSLPQSPVRPTLATVLDWAERAAEHSAGMVDVTLLDARLAAEGLAPRRETFGSGEGGGRGTAGLGPDSTGDPSSPWKLEQSGRRGGVVHRQPGVRFDLDGVAKGWIADRAADLLWSWPGALVDADGDIALHVTAGVEWLIGVLDPRTPDAPNLAVLRIRGESPWRRSLGVATSGTTVHRWQRSDGSVSHHLIDPRTGRPAATDVVQATVVGPSAREAEVLAKAALILGSTDGLALLGRTAAHAAILVLETGETVSLPGTGEWLA